MSIADYLNLFKDFKDREIKLRGITRYSLYPVMFYRTNLWTHSKRVAWITETIAPSAKTIWPNFNLERAILMALCHDDQEIIMGDIQAGNKAKMNEAQLAEIAQIEANAIQEISKQFPITVGPYNYRDLLMEIAEITTPEAMVVKYADKMDGFGEGMHEVYANNPHFTTNITNEYGTIPTAEEYYLEYFKNFTNRFPISEDWLKTASGNFMASDNSKQVYEAWKKLPNIYQDQEEIKNLHTQTEFL